MTPDLQNLISSSLEKGVSKFSSVLPCLVSFCSFPLHAFSSSSRGTSVVSRLTKCLCLNLDPIKQAVLKADVGVDFKCSLFFVIRESEKFLPRRIYPIRHDAGD